MRTKKKHSIARGLIIAVVLSNFSISLLVSFFYIKNDYEKQIESVKDSIQQIKKTYLDTYTLSTSVYMEDEEQTEKTLKGITESKDIAYVELKTDTGESFKSGKRKANEKIIESVFDIFFNEDLVLESKKVKIGEIRIVASLVDADERFKNPSSSRSRTN